MRLIISPRKLIYYQIIGSMLVKLVTQIIPMLSALEYIVDLINLILFFFIIKKLMNRRLMRGENIRYVVIMIFTMLLFDLIRALFTGTNMVLFFWGIRNQYRFLILFLATCLFWKIKDIEHFFQLCFYILLLNSVIITSQFSLGYRGDYLGGTFGLEKNVNAITNTFLCMMVTYGIIGNLYRKVSKKKAIIILLISSYWSALAEIKIFYVELVIIGALIFFLVRGRSLSKLKWVGSIVVSLGLGIIALLITFPGQVAYVTNISNMLWYAKTVRGGAYGFGRFTAFDIINNVFFNNDMFSKLIGIGVGNAEFMNVAGQSITSAFFDKYKLYMYYGYFHSMVYIERGILGLVWYALFWFLAFINSIRIRKNESTRMLGEFSIVFLVCVVIVAIKDSTLRVSISGYLISIMVAIPYIAQKENIKQLFKKDETIDVLYDRRSTNCCSCIRDFSC